MALDEGVKMYEKVNSYIKLMSRSTFPVIPERDPFDVYCHPYRFLMPVGLWLSSNDPVSFFLYLAIQNATFCLR